MGVSGALRRGSPAPPTRPSMRHWSPSAAEGPRGVGETEEEEGKEEKERAEEEEEEVEERTEEKKKK